MSNHLLILANSARMLAQAAHQAGFIPIVIDLYADRDTRESAHAWRQVDSLREDDIAPAVAFFLNHYPVKRAVYGSGFEAFPESLAYLQQRLQLCGNSPETFANIIDKHYFFQVLASLNIPYPISVFSAPDDKNDWLSKPLRGQGGVGIKTWLADSVVAGCYWQRQQSGIPHSVLFLADGHHVQVIGFNRQWTVAIGTEAFVFAGVINQTGLSDQQKALIGGWLGKLVPAFNLTGLNSLDFLQNGEDLWVLEINPRPSASMQLYAGDLMTQHINACARRLSPIMDFPPVQSCACQIIYAPCDLPIPDTMQWPENCLDIPPSGVICRKGQPICSIIAHHKTAQSVCEQLQYRQRNILWQLGIISHKLPD
ncbi:MAG: ATP-grasp domain-containing protein [Methylovulum sp.]|uniref:ATP-grasp domain-containing protein n=1 Tax=Methylovulum sp. TaxID=1916980 RepID=UPI002606BBE6|nr:ATP-grasp domain-containing protein [Methylovulum sp.]MDD2722663.1 ATP-grasp domain-containing protein [Methylovulum sp.]MDD5125152.1 ATP-grasp domain-containing protein [Methylovulum sp.]